MPSDAGDPTLADEEMHISPHPPKRPRDDARSPNVGLDYDEPTPKRSRFDDAHDDRRSRSPRPRSPPKNKPHRERSRSRSRSRSRILSRSRSRSRSRNRKYSQSPERRRSRRDSTPPFNRRRSSGGSGGAIPVPEPRDVRRKTDISQEERKRGQRLFGGLFSALGQPTAARARTRPGAGGPGGPGRPGSRLADSLAVKQQARPDGGRSENNADRRQDRQQPAGEDRRRQAERLVKLEQIRKIEQVKFDEKKMQTVHANELVLAQSLRTKSKPLLYYRPWKLTRKQEQTIEGQVQATKRHITEQKSDFQKEKQTRLSALGVRYTPKELLVEAVKTQAEEPKGTQPEETAKEDTDMSSPQPQPQQSPDTMADEPAADADTETKAPELPSTEIHAGHDLHDDKEKGIMVEHEEDTVIY